jgi:UDPglucose 6-dehydrogenase
MNDYQKRRFAQTIIREMFDNVRGKKLAIFGFAFKKDTGDTRETPAIDVVGRLIEEGAHVHIYDPKVKKEQMFRDLTEYLNQHKVQADLSKLVTIESAAFDAANGAHAIALLTEWDEFTTLDYERVFSIMETPSFIFDGRNILDHNKLEKIGFKVYAVGKGAL